MMTYLSFVACLAFLLLVMSRADSLRTLNGLRRSVPFASCRALDEILKAIEEDGLPDLSSRACFKEATDVDMDKLTPYVKLLTSLDLKNKEDNVNTVTVANVFAVIFVAVEHGGQIHRACHGVIVEDKVNTRNPTGSDFLCR